MRKMIQGKHLNKAVTVDMKTGETKPSNATMMLMPAKEGTCATCAVDHDPTHPHNAQSMFYQYAFYNEYGRWPTWKDAMEHCTDTMKKMWVDGLSAQGVNIEAGEVHPRRKR